MPIRNKGYYIVSISNKIALIISSDQRVKSLAETYVASVLGICCWSGDTTTAAWKANADKGGNGSWES